MRKKIIKYAISFTFSALLTLLFFILGNGLSLDINELDYYGKSKLLSVLSDAFFVPGAIVFAAGIFVFLNNNAVFDFFTYTGRSVMSFFVPIRYKKETMSYAEYQEKKHKNKAPCLYLIIVGSLFILLGTAFMIFYYLF